MEFTLQGKYYTIHHFHPRFAGLLTQNAKEFSKIMKLLVNVTKNGDRAFNGLQIKKKNNDYDILFYIGIVIKSLTLYR